ncbi:hypothetical protein [Amycolatopsis jejuensis]|uniref:hypothetical protein n=1 Tax=Amycolatopsis jejuensis TaxID=330084 RepID=UPI0005270475|nr:hypothetical protein [Amycolatopsis jejuensis]
MKRRAASALLVAAFAVLVFLAPAALVEQTGPAHSFRLTADGTLLAVAAGLIALAYGTFLLAWRAYRAPARRVLAPLLLVAVAVTGCNNGPLPDGPPPPARAPRPPADAVDQALTADDDLGAMLRAWRADVDSEPLYLGKVA